MRKQRAEYRKPMDSAMRNLALSLKYNELSGKEKTDIRKALRLRIKDWLPNGGSLSVRMFKEYVKSGYKTLPYAGGYAEQPEWVHEDFDLLHDVMDFHFLNEELRSPSEIKAAANDE